jgi:hypothetical protein
MSTFQSWPIIRAWLRYKPFWQLKSKVRCAHPLFWRREIGKGIQVAREIQAAPVDPIRPQKQPGWKPILAVLLVITISALMIFRWMIAAYAPSDSGDSRITKGMTKQEVLVVLGEPNERKEGEECWNYDRFHRGGDRFCVTFDDAGRVKEISH